MTLSKQQWANFKTLFTPTDLVDFMTHNTTRWYSIARAYMAFVQDLWYPAHRLFCGEPSNAHVFRSLSRPSNEASVCDTQERSQ
jgi:hypothetical protein